MNFIYYDLVFLTVFAIFIGGFLYFNRENLKKEGLLFLYKASWGIKLIDKIGGKHKKVLRVLSYVSIGLGYVLMGTMIWLFLRMIYIYIAYPSVVKAIKIPPITPLIPYLPQIFHLDFLPNFYFTYWIVILALIAIPHEFAHGIFAAANRVRIKSTGFGFFPFFLPVFLAAFVEQDEKSMTKKSNFAQMAILSAGTFANVLTGILFFGVLVLFFSLMFTPAGVIFNTYATAIVPVSDIDSVNGIGIVNHTYDEVLGLLKDERLNDILIGDEKYVGVNGVSSDGTLISLYYDSPAVRENLSGAILEINEVSITSIDELREELLKYSPGDKVNIKTVGDKIMTYDITLDKNPYFDSAWLGIGFNEAQSSGVLGKFYSVLGSFKDEHIYYEPKFDGWSDFVYNLLWWLVLISFSVALVNMLPVGIFDGGRFFYLTVLSITKSKKIAERSFAFMTYLFLFLLAVIMFFWFKNFLF
ncbi:MAG: site-2 protease family protein [Candidatus Pacearchaeota archaeon]|nr:site-2 protease family protein [Candidatus Pacearchaeota archaeon]